MRSFRFFIALAILTLLPAVFACAGQNASVDAPAAEQSAKPKKIVYLTFDDGPSEVTLTILDTLKKQDVPATFFVCGNVTDFGRDVYNRILKEGHALGNHTFSHTYKKVYASADAFEHNVTRLDDLIHEFTGKRTRLLRFPAGSNNRIPKNEQGKPAIQKFVDRMAAKGYRHFDWNVDSKDYGPNAKDPEGIVKTVVDGVGQRDRAIVLMHDSYLREATAKALPGIIAQLRDKGYVFKTLSKDSFTVQFLKPAVAE